MVQTHALVIKGKLGTDYSQRPDFQAKLFGSGSAAKGRHRQIATARAGRFRGAAKGPRTLGQLCVNRQPELDASGFSQGLQCLPAGLEGSDRLPRALGRKERQ